jgi:hypothetical protein
MLPGSDDWLHFEVDLSPFAGQLVHLRLVFDDPAEVPPGAWQIRLRAVRR